MGKLNFDNIMKTLMVQAVFTGVTLVSVEADFDIPRGFIVKVHNLISKIVSLPEDFEGISADKIAQLKVALIKDPDDITTVDYTSNQVDHDVLLVHTCDILIVANAADTSLSAVFLNTRREENFAAEGLDVFTARNMRLNVDAFGTDAADITESVAQMIIRYTLEKITDDLIIDLLDIL